MPKLFSMTNSNPAFEQAKRRPVRKHLAAQGLMSLAIVMLLVMPAWSDVNPFESVGGNNALGQAQATVYYEGGGLTLSIERATNAGVSGRLMLGTNIFPYATSGPLEAASARGTFVANGNRFTFTTTKNADGSIALKTGKSTYTLKRVARPTRPFPGTVAPNPGANVPGPNVPGPNVPGPNVPGPNVPGPNLPPNNVPAKTAPIFTALTALPNVRRINTAPDWVKPGTTITFWSGIATIQDQAGQETLVKDPNGDLEDANGNKYRRSTVAGGSGAVGFTQIEIVGVSSGVVIMTMSSFLHDGTIQKPALTNVDQMVAHSSGCEYWIHPTALKELAATSPFAFVGNLTTNGQTRSVVTIRDGLGHTIYDAASGVMMSFSQSTKNTGTETYYNPVTKTSQVRAKTGRTMIVTQFRSIRTNYRAKLAQMPLPPLAMTYKGVEASMVSTMDMLAGGLGPQQTGAGTFTSVPIERNGNWMAVKITPKQQRQPQLPAQPGIVPQQPKSLVRFVVPSDIAPSFLPLQFLQGLRQGQKLDQDPITGYLTSVTFVGRSRDGKPITVITRSGATEQSIYAYNTQTGMMLSYEKIERTPALIRTRINVTRVW